MIHTEELEILDPAKVHFLFSDFIYGSDYKKKMRNRVLKFSIKIVFPQNTPFGDLKIRLNNCRFRKNFDGRFTWEPPKNRDGPAFTFTPDLNRAVLTFLTRTPFASFLGPVGWEEESRGMQQPETTIIVMDEDDIDPDLTPPSIPPSADELLRMYNDFSLAPEIAKVYTEIGAPRPRAHMSGLDVQNLTLPSIDDAEDED